MDSAIEVLSLVSCVKKIEEEVVVCQSFVSNELQVSKLRLISKK